MTENSYICRLMDENPAGWENVLKEKHVRVKHDEEYPLVICSYEQFDADFSDPLVQEARGIIIDKDTKSVVCWPFRKFANYQESYADVIDWSSASVQEKLDGSLIKLWFHPYKNVWHFSTSGMIDAGKADVSGRNLSFLGIIKSAKNYKDIDFCSLDKDMTYLFELTSPEAQIVVKQGETLLWHIGTRNNVTGKESKTDIGIRKPARYSLSTMEDCIAAAEKLNASECLHEGFVVVDGSWNRIKIKSPLYFALHRAREGVLGKGRMTELIAKYEFDLKKLIEDTKADSAAVYWYAYQMKKFEKEIEGYIWYARTLYEELGKDRKAFARAVSGDKYAWFGFRALENEETAETLIKRMSRQSYLVNIEEMPGV